MKTAVIFCDKISERRLSHTISDFLSFNEKSTFFHYPTGFNTKKLNIEILKNHGGHDINGSYFKWYIDISTEISDNKDFEETLHQLNSKLESKCNTWTDWNYYLSL